MRAVLEFEDGVSVLRLGGELDHACDAELDAALLEAEADGSAGVVVDLSAVTYMESRAFGILMAAHRRLGLGERLVIVCPGPELMKLFHATRLDEVLHLVPTVREAVACLATAAM